MLNELKTRLILIRFRDWPSNTRNAVPNRTAFCFGCAEAYVSVFNRAYTLPRPCLNLAR